MVCLASSKTYQPAGERTGYMTKKIMPFLFLFIALAFTATISNYADSIFSIFNHGSEATMLISFFVVAIIFFLNFVIFNFSLSSSIPSFVIAIFFGIFGGHFLRPVIEERELLGAFVAFGATLILFGGGLEIPFKNFKKIIFKVFSLSFAGLFFTALSFSFVLGWLSKIFGLELALPAIILLGAILASTDPAAIIPILRQLRFTQRSTKDIIISESAVTDVTGAILTITFAGIFISGVFIDSIAEGYRALFAVETGVVLLKEVVFGIIFGVIGYLLLHFFTILKKRQNQEFETDAAFFIFVPLLIFALALAFGGSGYLAAFIAGLLYALTDHLHHTEKFFNHTIEGFLKPAIFLFLGALVDLRELIQYLEVGIIMALIFMFIIRPLAVFLSLGPFSFFGKDRLGWRELLFISFIRETGAIPAVLLVAVASLGIAGLDGLVPIGMWVILITLVVEPPLTPLVARILKVAEPIAGVSALSVYKDSDDMVILGSRGNSFARRLPKVVDWAIRHNISKVTLLYCLEDKYTPERAEKVNKQAEEEFKKINKTLEKENKPKINFSCVSCTGFLQDNIDALTKKESNISVIFVGRRILDYRLNNIKQMAVPLYFID